MLSEAGYVPSNTEKYPLGGVISAIQNAFHATPLLSCSNGAVEELQICFYKDFKVLISLLLYSVSLVLETKLAKYFYVRASSEPFCGINP